MNIRAATCPPDPKDRVQTVIIRPSDFLKDKLNITVEIICDCDCQIPPDVTPVSYMLRNKHSITLEIICDCDCQIPPYVTPVSHMLRDKLNITVEIPPDVTSVSYMLKEKLKITVEILCDCDCQIPPDVTCPGIGSGTNSTSQWRSCSTVAVKYHLTLPVQI